MGFTYTTSYRAVTSLPARSSCRRKRSGPCKSRSPSKRVTLVLGHTKLESTVRYLGIEVDDALEIADGEPRLH